MNEDEDIKLTPAPQEITIHKVAHGSRFVDLVHTIRKEGSGLSLEGYLNRCLHMTDHDHTLLEDKVVVHTKVVEGGWILCFLPNSTGRDKFFQLPLSGGMTEDYVFMKHED